MTKKQRGPALPEPEHDALETLVLSISPDGQYPWLDGAFHAGLRVADAISDDERRAEALASIASLVASGDTDRLEQVSLLVLPKYRAAFFYSLAAETGRTDTAWLVEAARAAARDHAADLDLGSRFTCALYASELDPRESGPLIDLVVASSPSDFEYWWEAAAAAMAALASANPPPILDVTRLVERIEATSVEVTRFAPERLAESEYHLLDLARLASGLAALDPVRAAQLMHDAATDVPQFMDSWPGPVERWPGVAARIGAAGYSANPRQARDLLVHAEASAGVTTQGAHEVWGELPFEIDPLSSSGTSRAQRDRAAQRWALTDVAKAWFEIDIVQARAMIGRIGDRELRRDVLMRLADSADLSPTCSRELVDLLEAELLGASRVQRSRYRNPTPTTLSSALDAARELVDALEPAPVVKPAPGRGGVEGRATDHDDLLAALAFAWIGSFNGPRTHEAASAISDPWKRADTLIRIATRITPTDIEAARGWIREAHRTLAEEIPQIDRTRHYAEPAKYALRLAGLAAAAASIDLPLAHSASSEAVAQVGGHLDFPTRLELARRIARTAPTAALGLLGTGTTALRGADESTDTSDGSDLAEVVISLLAQPWAHMDAERSDRLLAIAESALRKYGKSNAYETYLWSSLVAALVPYRPGTALEIAGRFHGEERDRMLARLAPVIASSDPVVPAAKCAHPALPCPPAAAVGCARCRKSISSRLPLLPWEI